MRAIHLQTEYLTEPLGLGIARPRFSWNCAEGVKQTACQIIAKRGDETVWNSGKVLSSAMTQIPYEGKPLSSRDRVVWSVKLWDEDGRPGSVDQSWFELGLLDASDWSAKWISGDYRPKKHVRYPVDCFYREFSSRGDVASARLYATARGIYDVTLNGHRIEDFILAPGVTDYRRRIQYQTYDVTALLKEQNVLELRLADGWFRGSVAAYGVVNTFGTCTSIMAQLEIIYGDGQKQMIITDGTWKWCNDGPLRFADLKDGEIYEAVRRPGYSDRARVVPGPENIRIAASDNVPVKEQEKLKAVLLTAEDGTRVLDFGQNIAGYLSFDVQGKAGERFRLVCGEKLDEKGRVDLQGIQETRPAKGWSQRALLRKLMTGKVSGKTDVTPRQEILFTCSGKLDSYKTSFSVFGFRYAEVDGDIPVDPNQFTAIAVYSDMERAGTFACSDGRVNRLFENTCWSMKGNFLDIPTDCPTRERLGWTGDAQIFFDTGAYLMDTAPFYRKWLRDMQDDVYPNGLLSAVVPWQGVEMMYKATGTSVGWADAIYLVPWRYYQRYGDRQLLSECWPMIEKYAQYLLSHLGQTDRKQAKENPYNAYTYEKGVHLGEWLEPEKFRDQVYGAKAKHPEECTAYLYYSMTTIAKIAKLLGHPSAEYEACADGAKKAYDALFVQTGTLDTDRQAKLVRPLALGLLEGEERTSAQKRLKTAVENFGFRVGTGFLSTAFLLSALTEAGETETAYRMLLNTEKPGWLAEVEAGATTIWEDWEGNLSQNHYSPGAVCQWLFDTVAGIRQDGEGRFLIAPVPGGTLTHAEACYRSLYGEVASRWEKTGSGTRFEITVPANTTAEIRLPDGEIHRVRGGNYIFER